MYVINTWNDDFDDLLFDGRQQICQFNDDNVENYNNGSIVDVYMNKCNNNKV